ncbi:MAG TPA: phosphatidate cytidylyltransferase, partial [Gemmataceae bacterium]|nr:phosphatidate cytidylyltransferase [Gemmataceae bacterium]
MLLTTGMLILDQWLAPWFPFLFVFVLGVSLTACQELVALLGSARGTQGTLVYIGVALLVGGNWWVHMPRQYGWSSDPWGLILGIFVALILAVFTWEMATFRLPDQGPNPEGGSIERMARTLWVLAYLGLLPCFLAQARWLYPNQPELGSVALALLIFVPKCCDIGAYGTGRLLGRHPMTPVLSPKKTWEGAAGGLTLGILAAIGI